MLGDFEEESVVDIRLHTGVNWLGGKSLSK
jgi:hypothetical protein